MRLLAIIWVALTVGVNVFALTGLLYEFWGVSTNWQAPFSTMGKFYAVLSDQIFSAAQGLLNDRFNFELPKWSVHALVAYAASASAVAASGLGIASREGFVDGVKSSGLSIAWPIGIVFLVWKAVRLQIVSKFARDHSSILAGYLIAVGVCYFGATYVNNNHLAKTETEISLPAPEVTDETQMAEG